MRTLFTAPLAFLLAAFTSHAAPEVQWKAPQISAENLGEWLEFVRPSEEEQAWQKIRWHGELEDAAKEAAKLQRPILLWTMNGHPCGET